MSMDTVPPVPTEIAIDPARDERMERLAQRSQAAKAAAANRTTGSDAPSADPARPTKKPKRRHAARSARYLSLALSALATVVLTVTFSLLSLPTIDQFALAAIPSQTTAQPGTEATVAATTTTPVPVLAAFDGAVVPTRWGPVQVQAQFKNGVLEDVVTLVYPNDRGTSININRQALPMLRVEALTAQSANVDTISGASVTSRGYVASLQSAIDAAQAAGAVNL